MGMGKEKKIATKYRKYKCNNNLQIALFVLVFFFFFFSLQFIVPYYEVI